MEAFKVQAQIRANAEEVQDRLKELQQWEKDMVKKDKQIRQRQQHDKSGNQVSGGGAHHGWYLAMECLE